jgi:diphthamide synthase (EF-2-diphthine--ammonia ligase)
MKKKIILSWSGGKDSAWALHLLRSSPAFAEYEVAALVTTLNERFRRVAIHGFREALLDRQAALAGLPLWKVDLPFPCTNDIYEDRMAAIYARAVAEGVHGVAFGDLFLEEIRAYRLRTLAPSGLEPLFPVWGIPTDQLAAQMIAGGLKARITCLDPTKLPADFAGREWNAQLLTELPATVDPAAKTASSTPSPVPGQCSRGKSPSNAATSSIATASSTQKCWNQSQHLRRKLAQLNRSYAASSSCSATDA